MSLINDALKRAQQEMGDKPVAAFPRQESSPPPLGALASPIATSKTPALISIIVAATILVFIGIGLLNIRGSADVPGQVSGLTTPAIANPISSPANPAAPTDRTAKPSAQEQPNNAAAPIKEATRSISALASPQAEAPVIAKKPRPALKLSGIMAGPSGEAALINGRMVRVGEEIEGVKLESIENQTAHLSFEGETFTLGI